MKSAAIAAVLLLATANAFAGNWLLFGVGSNSGFSGPPCTAGQIDLSLATGCNLPFVLGGLFP